MFDGPGLVGFLSAEFGAGLSVGTGALLLPATCDLPLKVAPSSTRTRAAWMSPCKVEELFSTARPVTWMSPSTVPKIRTDSA